MGFSKYYRFTLIAALVALPTLANADIWECQGKVFTTDPKFGEKCSRVNSSVVCGEGHNKYFSPSRGSLTPSTSNCPTTGKSDSPFINKGYAKTASLLASTKTLGSFNRTGTHKKSTGGDGAFDCILDYNGKGGSCGAGVGSWIDSVFRDVIGNLDNSGLND